MPFPRPPKHPNLTRESFPRLFEAPFLFGVVHKDRRIAPDDWLKIYSFQPSVAGWAVRRIAKATGYRFKFVRPVQLQLFGGAGADVVQALMYRAEGYDYVTAYVTADCPSADPSFEIEEL